jgi:hypothetical protein
MPYVDMCTTVLQFQRCVEYVPMEKPEVMENGEKLHNEKLRSLDTWSDIIRDLKPIKQADNETHIGKGKGHTQYPAYG